MRAGAFRSLRRDPSPGPATAPRRILLVSEQLNARRALAISLRVVGHAAVEASNAQEALRAAEAGEIDLVIVDAELQDMSGADLARTLEHRNPQVRVLLVADPVFPSQSQLSAELERTTIVERPLHVDAVLLYAE